MPRRAVAASLLVACSTRAPGTHVDGGGGGMDARPDSPAMDARPDAPTPIDAPPVDVPWDGADRCSESCGPEELCGLLGDGDGLDNDCNDEVDETCPCIPGTSRACFPGPPERRGVGACADGVMRCSEFERYGPCEGGRFPEAEVCDGADDDCDLSSDEGLVGCASGVLCPGSERATPLRAHPLMGSAIYSGAITSWTWTVTCPPTVTTCPTPDDPTARDTSIFFVSSGNYVVRAELVLEDGTSNQCEWVVYVSGEGLRVELDWDTQGIGRGDTDVDLHLHRRSVPPGTMTGETDFFTPDDCFYLDCKASTYGYLDGAMRARWMLPDTADLSVCEDAPGGEGGLWTALHGACFNPRLDVDVISCDPSITDPQNGAFCAPENINIDDPPMGDTYRVWVNYYSQHEYTGLTNPSVSIYCFGELRGTFGGDTPLIILENGDPTTNARLHDNWHVADVMFYIDECGRPACRVAPLGEIRNDALFGAPWSF